jgi:hypothetical protein
MGPSLSSGDSPLPAEKRNTLTNTIVKNTKNTFFFMTPPFFTIKFRIFPFPPNVYILFLVFIANSIVWPEFLYWQLQIMEKPLQSREFADILDPTAGTPFLFHPCGYPGNGKN